MNPSQACQQQQQSHNTNNSLCSLNDKKWLRTKEAAAYLGRSEGAIYNLVYRGQLVAARFGKALMFSRESIDRLIENSVKGGF